VAYFAIPRQSRFFDFPLWNPLFLDLLAFSSRLFLYRNAIACECLASTTLCRCVPVPCVLPSLDLLSKKQFLFPSVPSSSKGVLKILSGTHYFVCLGSPRKPPPPLLNSSFFHMHELPERSNRSFPSIQRQVAGYLSAAPLFLAFFAPTLLQSTDHCRQPVRPSVCHKPFFLPGPPHLTNIRSARPS